MGRYPLHSDTVAGQYGFVFTIQTVGQLPVVMETNTIIQYSNTFNLWSSKPRNLNTLGGITSPDSFGYTSQDAKHVIFILISALHKPPVSLTIFSVFSHKFLFLGIFKHALLTNYLSPYSQPKLHLMISSNSHFDPSTNSSNSYQN